MSQVTYEIIRKLLSYYSANRSFSGIVECIFSVGERDMDCCRNIGSDEYLHGAMAGKAGGNTIYNVRCHCVGILFLQIPKTFGKGGIHTAAVLQFSCVKLFDCRQYLSMYSGEHI